MPYVACPKCGQRLELPEVRGSLRLRCPACKHIFAVSRPAPRQTSPMEYDEESMGTFPKALLGTLGAMGIALVAFLIYKIIEGPEPPQPPAPAPIAIQARDNKPKPPAPASKPAYEPLPKEVLTRGSKASTQPKTGLLEALKRAADEDAKKAKPKPPSEQLPMPPDKLFAKASPSVVRVIVYDGQLRDVGFGSGFFVSADGLLVTNYHVIRGGRFASVLLHNNATLAVTGVAASMPDADLVLLKVKGKDLPHLTIARDEMPKVGVKVFAIGNPQGLTNTFSEGMVSGHRRVERDLTLIQTTAAISQGSSGGPLLTADGSVVGATTLYFLGGQNLNFAVPAASIRRLVRARGAIRPFPSGGARPWRRPARRSEEPAPAAKDAWKDRAAWARLREGMTEAQVVAILGPPTGRRSYEALDKITLWYYYHTVTLTHKTRRLVEWSGPSK